jgi:CubicO group peptidase (beta-lactamase class C family)
MNLYATAFGLLVALPFVALDPAPAPAPPADHFPPSTALAEGVSRKTLGELGSLIQSFVDDEEIVGAELLVIKNGRSILHEAYGLSDQEAGVPMETGSVFCVRSMTKPLIGTSILMLVDDGEIALDDPISKYLPEFDVEGKRGITIQHLITHTSGLGFSMIAAADPRKLESVRAVAALGAGSELQFEPGTDFQYSDQGTDTLTALIEAVTDVSAEDFVTARVLVPLGMDSSTCLMTSDHHLRGRALSKYAGSRGAWTRFWSPEDEALFPIFLGSQGLYSSLEDYARFMELWMNQGRVGSRQLLPERSVQEALTPCAHPFPGSTGLPGLTAGYGSLMQLWMDSGVEGQDGETGHSVLTAFGHTGSDGTHAWVFPEQQAMVLYFTQSRGTITGLQVEEVLGQLFLGASAPTDLTPPPLEDFLGYYREDESDMYRAVVRDGDDLALEILGRAVATLSYAGQDCWKIRQEPANVLAFDRSESGEVTGYHVGDHQEFRFEPDDSLPSSDDIAALIMQAHRMDLLESLGPIQIRSALTIESLNVSGELSNWIAWPNLFRVDGEAAGTTEHTAFDGDDVRYESSTEALSILKGPRAESSRLDNLFACFGDLRDWYPELRAIQQLDDKGRQILLVRMGDASRPASTFFVEAETGQVRRIAAFPYMPGLGRVGMRTSFGEFTDVSGVLLPFRTEVDVANPFIGTIDVKVSGVEVGVELPEGGFDLGAEGS